MCKYLIIYFFEFILVLFKEHSAGKLYLNLFVEFCFEFLMSLCKQVQVVGLPVYLPQGMLPSFPKLALLSVISLQRLMEKAPSIKLPKKLLS